MTCEKKKNSLVVYLNGEIDHHKADEVKEIIDYKLESAKVKNIIFDFSGVTFMDSAGVGLIIGRYKTICRLNGQAAIVNAIEPINRILDISGIFKIMKYHDTLASAIKSLE